MVLILIQHDKWLENQQKTFYVRNFRVSWGSVRLYEASPHLFFVNESKVFFNLYHAIPATVFLDLLVMTLLDM